jgi:hypothetical protein
MYCDKLLIMTEPEVSPLPVCSRCRREKPCVKVETVYGDRNLCVAECWKLWTMLHHELKRRVGHLLWEYQADFFDEPTRPDLLKNITKS